MELQEDSRRLLHIVSSSSEDQRTKVKKLGEDKVSVPLVQQRGSLVRSTEGGRLCRTYSDSSDSAEHADEGEDELGS